MIRKGQSSTKLISGIDVSGFAGIMLFLVCLLMVPVGMHVDLPSRVSVDLPKAVHPRLVPHARREDAIFVAITRSGNIFFGRDLIPPDILHDRVKEAVKSGAEGIVYVNADARTKYKNVKDVIDQVSRSGLKNVVFLSDERRKP